MEARTVNKQISKIMAEANANGTMQAVTKHGSPYAVIAAFDAWTRIEADRDRLEVENRQLRAQLRTCLEGART